MNARFTKTEVTILGWLHQDRKEGVTMSGIPPTKRNMKAAKKLIQKGLIKYVRNRRDWEDDPDREIWGGYDCGWSLT